ncbi:MAG: NAD(+) diphosphatase [Pseudomonadota bacterium]
MKQGGERFRAAVQPPESPVGEHWWIAVLDGRVLLLEEGGAVPFPLLRSFGLTGLDSIARHYLGVLDGRHVYAVGLPAGTQAPPGMYFEELRRLLVASDPMLFALAGRARQVLDWAVDHRHCSRCGSPATPHASDRAMVCTACGYTQYPRLAPCVIVLVTRGDRALLARSPNFPPGMFSTLAGFVEAGENVEEALAREVREEVGVQVRSPRYIGSQSWPFPHSLMLGFHAEWAGGEIAVDGEEIVEADWFAPDALPLVPPAGSISRRLIDAWRNAARHGDSGEDDGR